MNSLSTCRSQTASVNTLRVRMKQFVITHTVRAITHRNIVTLSVFSAIVGELYVKDLEVQADDTALGRRRRGLYGVLAV